MGGIQRICEGEYGMKRRVEAIRWKWRKIKREYQHYIAARALVDTKLSTDRNVEEAAEHVQRVYCKRAGTRDSSGKVRLAPPFQYFEAAAFLSKQQKWADGMTTATRETSRPSLSGDAVDALSGGTPPARELSASGSGGVQDFTVVSDDVETKSVRTEGSTKEPKSVAKRLKAVKAERKRAKCEGLLSDIRQLRGDMSDMKTLMGEMMVDQREEAEEELDLALLQHLPEDSAERIEILNEMLQERKSRKRKASCLENGSNQDGNTDRQR